MVDAKGNSISWTGEKESISGDGVAGPFYVRCGPQKTCPPTTRASLQVCIDYEHAGALEDENASPSEAFCGKDFAVQSNFGNKAAAAMAKAYVDSKGHFADRLLAALEAAHLEGDNSVVLRHGWGRYLTFALMIPPNRSRNCGAL